MHNTTQTPSNATLVVARRAVRTHRPRVLDAGLPEVPNNRWARLTARNLTVSGDTLTDDAIRDAVLDAYLADAGPIFLAQHLRDFAGLAKVKDFDDTETLLSLVGRAALETLSKVVRRAFDGHCSSSAYLNTVFRTSLVNAGREERARSGGMAREDWFGRAAGRRALFDGEPDLLWLADKVTRQLYRPPFRADVERADPFPLAAWADELNIDDPTAVRNMIDEVIDRIAEHCPDEFEHNMASSLQRLHERLAPPDRSAERSR